MEYMDGVGLRPCVHLHISPASEYMSGTVNKVPLIFQYSSAAITRERERAYSWSLYKTKMARHDVLVFVVAVSHNIPAVFFLLLSSGENKSGARTDWMCEVQDRSMRWLDI